MGGRRRRSWKVVALIGNTFSFFLENNVHHLVHLNIWVTILVIYFEGMRSCKRCISLDFNFSFAFWLLIIIKYHRTILSSIPVWQSNAIKILTQACQPKGFFCSKACGAYIQQCSKRRHLQEARPHFDNHFWDQSGPKGSKMDLNGQHKCYWLFLAILGLSGPY